MDLAAFFLELFVPNTLVYFATVIIVCFLVLPIHKWFVKSITDPFFYQLWMSVLAYSLPVFLYCVGAIELKYLIFFLFCTIFFWLGVSVFKKPRIEFATYRLPQSGKAAKYLFIVVFLIYAISIMSTYIFFGIPLFYSNRNDVFKDSGGFGVIQRLIPFAVNYILIYSFHQLIDNKKTNYRLFIFFVILNSVLSGGKSAILGVVFCFFYYSYFLNGQVPKLNPKYLVLILAFPVIVLGLTVSNGLSAALLDLGVRLVANGDIYILAYPNNMVESVHISNPISHLLIGVLAPLRIVSYNDPSITVQPIGLLLNYEVNPILQKLGITTAPNSRLDVIAWIYYKWGGIFLSFFIGIVASWFIYRLPKFFPQSIIGISFYSSFYFSALCFIVDPGLAFSYIFDSFFNLIIYSLILCVIYIFIYYYHITQKNGTSFSVDRDSSL